MLARVGRWHSGAECLPLGSDINFCRWFGSATEPPCSYDGPGKLATAPWCEADRAQGLHACLCHQHLSGE